MSAATGDRRASRRRHPLPGSLNRCRVVRGCFGSRRVVEPPPAALGRAPSSQRPMVRAMAASRPGPAERPRYAPPFIAGLVAVVYIRRASGAPSAGVSGSGFRLRGGWQGALGCRCQWGDVRALATPEQLPRRPVQHLTETGRASRSIRASPCRCHHALCRPPCLRSRFAPLAGSDPRLIAPRSPSRACLLAYYGLGYGRGIWRVFRRLLRVWACAIVVHGTSFVVCQTTMESRWRHDRDE